MSKATAQTEGRITIHYYPSEVDSELVVRECNEIETIKMVDSVIVIQVDRDVISTRGAIVFWPQEAP